MTVELHETPWRHYKIDGSWTSNKRRIVSVTTVLSGVDNLTSWAAQQAVAAGAEVAETWCGWRHDSVLSFGEACKLTGLMPDDIRDAAAERGTALHSYFSTALTVPALSSKYALPYGYCAAIDLFIAREQPEPIRDFSGWRVERAVGDAKRAVAGTYDAQVRERDRPARLHRLELKSSNTVQPKHFAQLAAYERMAIAAGEDGSDYLTIVHIDGAGNYALHSIAVGSEAHNTAERMFDAYLHIYRANSELAKVLK